MPPAKREMSKEELQLLQGTLDVLVLKTLSWQPSHGYAIARAIKDVTEGDLQVEDRALYVALHRMEERGWIASEWGQTENNRRAKYYRLTREGRRQLGRELRRWERYAAAVSKVLTTASAS